MTQYTNWTDLAELFINLESTSVSAKVLVRRLIDIIKELSEYKETNERKSL